MALETAYAEIAGARKMAAREAAGLVLMGHDDVDKLKKRLGQKYALSKVLRNSEILAEIPKGKRGERIMGLLRLRKMRTLSGVAPIAVMTFSNCPHGRCTYCPRGERAAQSYTGYEPASLRGRQNGFDGYRQVSA